MKKLIYIFSSLAMIVAMSNFVQAQEPQPKQSAKEKREARKAKQAIQDSIFAARMEEALKSENFTFWANYLSSGTIIRQPIVRGFREFVLNNNLMTVRLPYVSTSRDISSTPMVIDFTAKDYKYSYENRKGVFYVKIELNNVINNQSTAKLNNSSYMFNFRIMVDGSTSLTVTPSYMAPITYDGSISIGGVE